MKRCVSIIILAAIAGGQGWIGCRSGGRFERVHARAAGVAAAPEEGVISGEEAEKRAEAFARYATGVTYELNEEPERAQEEYFKSALADPANESLVIELARRLIASKQSGKALELLSKSAERPDAAAAIFAWQARAYLSEGKTNRAAAASRSAIKRNPEVLGAYQILVDVYLKNGQPRDAWKVLEEASAKTESEAVFLIGLSELYDAYGKARPGEAVEVRQRSLALLERAMTLTPNPPGTRQKIADQFASFGETERAAALYLQLLSEFAHLPIIRDSLREKLANLYLRGSDTSKATEQLEAIVRDNPTRYPQAYYYLGSLAFEDKKFEKAEEYFNKALLFKPDLEQAYYDLASSQLNLRKTQEALQTLEKARERYPQSFVAEFFTGLALGRLKNYDEAFKHFLAAEMIARVTDPKRVTPAIYFHLGATSERKGDLREAEKYFNKCLDLSPDHAEALNYLGYMWADKGINLEKALEMIEKAVQLEPKNPAYLDSLGWVLYKLNRPQEALAQVLKAVELNEEPDPTLFEHVGDIYQALQDSIKAREAWQKSLAIEPREEVRKKLGNIHPSS